MQANRIAPGSNFIAIVDGKRTGLAGCATPCKRAGQCLRTDSALRYQWNFKSQGACLFFIPNA